MPSAIAYRNTISIAAFVVAGFVLLPQTASANHGLQALGALTDFLIKLVGSIVAVGFILSLVNLRVKALWLRVLSTIFMMPLFGILLFMGTSFPLGSFILAGWLLFQGFLIYLSIPDHAAR